MEVWILRSWVRSQLFLGNPKTRLKLFSFFYNYTKNQNISGFLKGSGGWLISKNLYLVIAYDTNQALLQNFKTIIRNIWACWLSFWINNFLRTLICLIVNAAKIQLVFFLSDRIFLLLFFSTDTEAEHKLVKQMALDNGAFDAVLCTHWADGGAGAVKLADAVIAACEKSNNFKFLYKLDLTIEEKIITIAKEMYGAGNIEFTKEVLDTIQKYKRLVLL